MEERESEFESGGQPCCGRGAAFSLTSWARTAAGKCTCRRERWGAVRTEGTEGLGVAAGRGEGEPVPQNPSWFPLSCCPPRRPPGTGFLPPAPLTLVGVLLQAHRWHLSLSVVCPDAPHTHASALRQEQFALEPWELKRSEGPVPETYTQCKSCFSRYFLLQLSKNATLFSFYLSCQLDKGSRITR